MWKVYSLLGLVWLALMPPFFTSGRCSAEFDEAMADLTRAASKLRNPDSAYAYFQQRSVPVSMITPQQCRSAKPRFLSQCGSGALVYAKVPGENSICSFYRDESIQIQLHFDDKGRLIRFFGNMAPFKTLPLPMFGSNIHWAK